MDETDASPPGQRGLHSVICDYSQHPFSRVITLEGHGSISPPLVFFPKTTPVDIAGSFATYWQVVDDGGGL